MPAIGLQLGPPGDWSDFAGNGAQGRNRTADTVIFSHVLYQLSYLGSRDRADRPSKRRAH